MISAENINHDENQQQVISRKRVADHGEVYTAKREVNAMLDLVKQETERIDSRFLVSPVNSWAIAMSESTSVIPSTGPRGRGGC